MNMDMRKQRIFAALEGATIVNLNMVADKANVTRQLAARELNRLGWVKRPVNSEYRRPSTPARRVRA
jgi:predicted transcriptional regulator of viral defense system